MTPHTHSKLLHPQTAPTHTPGLVSISPVVHSRCRVNCGRSVCSIVCCCVCSDMHSAWVLFYPNSLIRCL